MGTSSFVSSLEGRKPFLEISHQTSPHVSWSELAILQLGIDKEDEIFTVDQSRIEETTEATTSTCHSIQPSSLASGPLPLSISSKDCKGRTKMKSTREHRDRKEGVVQVCSKDTT